MSGIFFKINDNLVELSYYDPSVITIYNLHGEYIDSFEVYPSTDISESIYNVLLRHFQNQPSKGVTSLAEAIDIYFKTKKKIIDTECDLWAFYASQNDLRVAGLVEQEPCNNKDDEEDDDHFT